MRITTRVMAVMQIMYGLYASMSCLLMYSVGTGISDSVGNARGTEQIIGGIGKSLALRSGISALLMIGLVVLWFALFERKSWAWLPLVVVMTPFALHTLVLLPNMHGFEKSLVSSGQSASPYDLFALISLVLLLTDNPRRWSTPSS